MTDIKKLEKRLKKLEELVDTINREVANIKNMVDPILVTPTKLTPSPPRPKPGTLPAVIYGVRPTITSPSGERNWSITEEGDKK